MGIYDGMMRSLEEALAYEKGLLPLRSNRMSIIEPEEFSARDIKNIRRATGLSQAAFAAAMGVSKKSVEAWEAGRNNPSGAAKRLLAFVEEDPGFFENNEIVLIERLGESKKADRYFSVSSTSTFDLNLPDCFKSPVVITEA